LTDQAISLTNIEYILDYYSLDNKNLVSLKLLLEQRVDFDTSFDNVVKLSFNDSVKDIKEYKTYPNIFFDKDLYINLEKHIFKSMIEYNTGAIKDI
jgi:hypothetical protein